MEKMVDMVLNKIYSILYILFILGGQNGCCR